MRRRCLIDAKKKLPYVEGFIRQNIAILARRHTLREHKRIYEVSI